MPATCRQGKSRCRTLLAVIWDDVQCGRREPARGARGLSPGKIGDIARAALVLTPTTPLHMPRYGTRAHWPYDRVDEGLTKTAGQCPERREDLVEAESERQLAD